MDDVKEQILSYSNLSIEERREVDAYVEDHPEWAPLLRDVRSLESLRRERSEAPDDASLLSTYVAVQHFHPDTVPSHLQEAFRRLEERFEKDPALRVRADELRQQLETKEAELDPASHFEELTGHSLVPDESGQENAAEALSATERAHDRNTAPASRSLLDHLLQLPLALRLGGAAAVLLLGTYAVLFAVSTASQTTLDRLATVRMSDQMVESYYTANTRSATPTSDTASASDLYLRALSSLRDARTSTFGLFPNYNPDSLQKVESTLTQVLEETDNDSFLALEAQFYLGKTYLAQGRVPDARACFTTVVELEGRRAQEAQNILETLREEYPAQQNGTNS